MSTSDIITVFVSCNFDLDDTASMNFTLFRRVCMDPLHKRSKRRQKRNLETSVRTQNKHLLGWRTRSEGGYLLETANIDERQGGSSYSRESRGAGFPNYRSRPPYTYRHHLNP